MIEHLIVFFESPNGIDRWKPVDREHLPDWIRDDAVIQRMIGGEIARNATKDEEVQSGERHFKVLQIDRPRPEGQTKARAASILAALGVSSGGIALPH